MFFSQTAKATSVRSFKSSSKFFSFFILSSFLFFAESA